jgi:hypothetical protein
MSGYLQRLVNAAAGGGDAVHPRTGSVFSPRVEETPAPMQLSQDNDPVAAAGPHARLRGTSPLAESADAATDVASESRPIPLFPAASELPAVRTVFSPPLVRAASPRDIDTLVHADERTREPQRAEHDRAPDVSGVEPMARDVAETSPIFPTRGGRTEPRTRSAEPKHLRSERQVGQRGEQPDDIQIHIGRIEVIAVPPPAPPAPKAPDRSVSLEAYLNRRDGRPR